MHYQEILSERHIWVGALSGNPIWASAVTQICLTDTVSSIERASACYGEYQRDVLAIRSPPLAQLVTYLPSFLLLVYPQTHLSTPGEMVLSTHASDQ